MAVSANHQSSTPGGESPRQAGPFQRRDASGTMRPSLISRLLPAGTRLAILARMTRQVPRPGPLVGQRPGSKPWTRSDAVAMPSARADPQDAARRLVEVQETVRREMADYLHGHVQSKLVALSISLGFCQNALRRDPSTAYRMLERVQEELRHIQDEDLRRVSRELFPAIIKIGLLPAMQSLVDRFRELIDIEIIVGPDAEFLDQTDGNGLPEKLRLGVYRVAEEALTNVLKHAQASHVRISLDREGPDHLLVSVADNGRGFDPARVSTSQGLLGMADYAQAIGGQVRITSAPGQGATVGLLLPVPRPEQSEAGAPTHAAAALPPAA